MCTHTLLSARISKNTAPRYAVALAATLTALVACRALNPFMSDCVPYVLLIKPQQLESVER